MNKKASNPNPPEGIAVPVPPPAPPPICGYPAVYNNKLTGAFLELGDFNKQYLEIIKFTPRPNIKGRPDHWIQWSFDKNRKVKVFNANTGKDITHKFEVKINA